MITALCQILVHGPIDRSLGLSAAGHAHRGVLAVAACSDRTDGNKNDGDSDQERWRDALITARHGQPGSMRGP